MKRLRLLIGLTFVFCLVAFVLTIGEYLALHDISTDYVSGQVLQSLGVSLVGELPPWTETKAEWAMLSARALKNRES